jgi:hypothetical protein
MKSRMTLEKTIQPWIHCAGRQAQRLSTGIQLEAQGSCCTHTLWQLYLKRQTSRNVIAPTTHTVSSSTYIEFTSLAVGQQRHGGRVIRRRA